MINQNQILNFLNDLALFSRQAIELKQVLDLVMDNMVNKFGMEAGILFLHNPRTGYSLTSSRHLPVKLRPEIDKRYFADPYRNWPQVVAQDQQPLVFNKLSEDGHFDDIWGDVDKRSSVYFALKAKNEIRGVICLIAGEDNPISEEDGVIYDTLGCQIGLLIDNYLILQSATNSEREALTLYQMGTQFGDALDEKQILKTAAESARYMLTADVGILALLDEESDRLTIRATSEHKPKTLTGLRIPMSTQSIKNTLAFGRPIILDQTITSQSISRDTAWITDHDFEAYLAMPLIYQGYPSGIIGVLYHNPRRFTRDEIKMIRRLSNMVVYPLGSAFQYKRGRSLGAVEERMRLAREMHDQIAQELSYVNMKISSTEELLSGGQTELAQLGLQQSKRILTKAYENLREIIFNLRTPIITGDDFFEKLCAYLEDYKLHYGFQVDLQLDEQNVLNIPHDVAVQISSVIQEALTNARKHAGSNEALMKVERPSNWLIFTIEDRGVGFDPDKEVANDQQGIGLQVMRERAESIGAQLEISSHPGQGTIICIKVPMNEEDY